MQLIAETAWHHDGDSSFFSQLIKDIVQKTDTGYVKFHISLDVDEYISQDHDLYEMVKTKTFSVDKWKEFIQIVIDGGKKIMLLVNDKAAIDLACEYSPELIEIHSVCLNDNNLVQHLREKLPAKTKVVLGVGGSTLYEIENAIMQLNTDKIILMHGFQNYPTRYEDINLKKINKIRQLYPNFEHGYADHTAWDEKNNVLITLLGAAQGMEYVEKHVSNTTGEGRPDFQAAVSIEIFNDIAKKLHLLEQCNGDGRLALNAGEKNYSIYGPNKKAAILVNALKAGDKLNATDFTFKRTSQHTDISQIEALEYIGFRVKRDLTIGYCLTHNDFEEEI